MANPPETDLSVMHTLHPRVRDTFISLARSLIAQWEAGLTKTQFRPFEAYRSPIAQRQLYAKRPKVTNADAWQSPHQYGLAVDFVPIDDKGRWSWASEHDWPFLWKLAANYGLRHIGQWDKAHIESPLWDTYRKLLRNETDPGWMA